MPIFAASCLIISQAVSALSSTVRFSLLYPKILACLTEMRTMNEEYTKQVLHILDVKPDNSFHPLIQEVVSKDP